MWIEEQIRKYKRLLTAETNCYHDNPVVSSIIKVWSLLSSTVFNSYVSTEQKFPGNSYIEKIALLVAAYLLRGLKIDFGVSLWKRSDPWY